MTHDELKQEIRALEDLAQRYSERFETLSRRLHRHFDAAPGGGKTDFRKLTATRADLWPLSGRQDDGGD